MSTVIYWLFIYYSLLLVINGSLSNNTFNLTDNESAIILYPNELNICKMYNYSCYFTMLLKKPLTAEYLNAEIDLKYASVDKIIQCDDYNQTSANFEFIFECNKTNKSIDYDVYLVKIIPLLIGYTTLTMSANLDNKTVFAKQRLVVKEPERFVDKFWVVFVWTIQISISLLMGILLDIAALKKILTMPIPVGIGFTCQYIFMPLVCFKF